MQFRHFLQIIALPSASILILAAGAVSRTICSTTYDPQSKAERYVLKRLEAGEAAGLLVGFPPERFSENQRQVRGSFIAAVLTNRDGHFKIPSSGVWISGAVVTGSFELYNEEIPYDVSLVGCTFNEGVGFSGANFRRGLDLSYSTFNGFVNFSGATVGFDFIADGCSFSPDEARFQGMKVGRDFRIGRSKFFTEQETSFQSVRVGGVFEADNSIFDASAVRFDDMRVDSSFSARHCTFSLDYDTVNQLIITDEGFAVSVKVAPPAFMKISFTGARFTDVFLNECSFEKTSTIDFTRMRADLISFDDVRVTEPSEIILHQATFRLLSPVELDKLRSLLAHYDPEFYANLEASWRTHGYPDQADNLFIAKKRAERRENCKSFLHQCDRGSWALSLFKDLLAGYGKSLQNLLYWSLGFLIVGTLVFRSEKGMRAKDRKDAPYLAGRYHAFWYSLDLFLPIIKLGEAETWTPKDNRRWAILYKKVHIIIGSLFVPIGLAAWTGIIK